MQNQLDIRNKEEKKPGASFDIANLLYFSLSSFTERYISASKNLPVNGKENKGRSLLSRTKGGVNSLFAMAGGGIERLLSFDDAKKPAKMPHSKKITKGYASAVSAFTRAFRSTYFSFTNYADKSYKAAAPSGRKRDTFVKLTLLKVIRLYEQLTAILQPQWNKVEGSPEDMDSRAMTMSQKDSIGSDNARYEFGYQFLHYRS